MALSTSACVGLNAAAAGAGTEIASLASDIATLQTLVSGISAPELGFVDGVTAGTVTASKALVVDSNKAIQSWTYNGTNPLKISNTVTSAGTSIDGLWTITTTEVALGTYANAFNGKLDFGTAGSVTGLGGAVCAEVDLGAGCNAGSYACFEAELIMPSGALTGTRTSFMTMNLSGAAAGTFDTNGFIFDINGVTIASGKAIQASAVTDINSTHAMKIQINGTTYYIPLHTAANFGG